MNVEELGTFLRSRPIDEPPLPTVDETVTRVHRAVSAARLRIVVTVVAVMAVITGLLTAGVTPWHRASTDFTNRTVDGFPEYAPGYRVAATADSTKSGVVTMRVTNKIGWLLASVRCPTVDPLNYVSADLAINGAPYLGFDCHRDSATAGPSANNLSFLGISGVGTGRAFTVTIRLSRADGVGFHGPAGDLAAVPFSAAIYQPVPFSEVPLPRRPAHLATLKLSDQGSTIFQSDPGHPDQPITFSTTWHSCGIAAIITCLSLGLASTTPGEFVVTINGVRSGVFDVYDYDARPMHSQVESRDETLGPTLAEGTPLTVVVTPRYATGPWAVQRVP